MNSIVQVEHVSKRYHLGLTRTSLPESIPHWIGESKNGSKPHSELWVLHDVSFALERGQSLALIGPTGAGKTTILKLLANTTKPTTGRVQVNGTLSALIELGAGFHPDLTGRENIYVNGTILGLSRTEIKHRFEEIVEFAELGRFVDTPLKRYSSAMIVRLGFAIAACVEPDVLLLDEVLAVGDAAFQEQCLQRIRGLAARGTSIVLVSHNLHLVQFACDLALYLRGGAVQHFGAVDDVIDYYEADLRAERKLRGQARFAPEICANSFMQITPAD